MRLIVVFLSPLAFVCCFFRIIQICELCVRVSVCVLRYIFLSVQTIGWFVLAFGVLHSCNGLLVVVVVCVYVSIVNQLHDRVTLLLCVGSITYRLQGCAPPSEMIVARRPPWCRPTPKFYSQSSVSVRPERFRWRSVWWPTPRYRTTHFPPKTLYNKWSDRWTVRLVAVATL